MTDRSALPTFAEVVKQPATAIEATPAKQGPRFNKVGSVIGNIMTELSSVNYADRVLIIKALGGSLGLTVQIPNTVTKVSQGTVSSPLPKAKEPQVSSPKEKKPVSQKGKKEKKVSKKPPPKNPANADPQVVSLKRELLDIQKEIETVAKALPCPPSEPKVHLPDDHPLVSKKQQILGRLTVAKGSFRAFQNLEIEGSRKRGRSVDKGESWADYGSDDSMS